MSDLTSPPRSGTEDDFPMIAKVCAHWTEQRRRHALPMRSALDPAALAEALPHVFLGEFIGPRVVRLRLCGHAVEEVMGMDLRGMPLTALFGADARADITAALEQVGRGVRAMLALQAEPGFGQPQMCAQLALLPLTDAEGRITHVLGVLERHCQIGRKPRRFATALATPVVEDNRPMLRVITGGKR